MTTANLYRIGDIEIKIAPFSINRIRQTSRTDYAIKPVMGGELQSEHVGEGLTNARMLGQLFPKAFGGTLEILEQLQEMRRKGEPNYVMRGDGEPLGWMVITGVDLTSDSLAKDGVGRIVDFTIDMHKTPKPNGKEAFDRSWI